MKKVLLTLIVVMSSVSAFAMSSYRARQEAWFLTDKMAYELYLTEDQMQDVKNILVLQNWLERTRKEVTNKVLSIKQISEFLNFPILAQPTLKKI